MATPSRDAIETYMSITGASQSLAVQKLEEYGGNLNEAVNAHFNGGDILITSPPPTAFPQPNVVQSNNESRSGHGLFPMLSAARTFKPSLLLDPNYRRDLYSRISAAGASLLSPSRAGTVVPTQPNHRHEQLHPIGPSPNIWNDHTPIGYSSSYPDNHLEDEMIQAAIKASIREAEVSSDAGLSERQFHQEDAALAHAVSLSLKTVEQERAVREQQLKDNYHQELEVDRRSKPGSSSNQNGAQALEEEQQLRQKSNHGAGSHPQHYEEVSHYEEWGGMSSKELDEALMLETALFGGISEGASNSSLIAPQQQSGLGKHIIPDPQPRHPASPSLSASCLLKEQQDKEYHASLLVDKQKEEESHRKMLNEVEFGRTLAAKKASLPCQPALNDENAVTVLVRMPNGSRVDRRFLKSDKLQLLFDFIDISGEVKPGTYRVVRSYPRRAFNVNESLLTLAQLGLTNKQEALFLELI